MEKDSLLHATQYPPTASDGIGNEDLVVSMEDIESGCEKETLTEAIGYIGIHEK